MKNGGLGNFWGVGKLRGNSLGGNEIKRNKKTEFLGGFFGVWGN